jgi:hypothetical protein
MPSPFEPSPVSAWIEPRRLERALRVLSDPRLQPTRVGSPDAATRRALAERFDAEPFDDLRRLAVRSDSAIWIDRAAPLDEADAPALATEDLGLVAGSCSLAFLLSVPQCVTAPSFRRTAVGRTLLSMVEAFGRVEVFQATVAVPDEDRFSEGMRIAASAALAVLGPIDAVTALGARAGTITATVVGERGFGTLAIGRGGESCNFALVGEGGLATVTPTIACWHRADGSLVEETRLESDGVEPTIGAILEAERPSARESGARSAPDEQGRRMRVRSAALVEAIALSARTGHSESVEELLRGYGVDPHELRAK